MKQLLIVSACLVVAAAAAWSFYVASRYQALCELSYWSASAAELKLCDERLAELRGR